MRGNLKRKTAFEIYFFREAFVKQYAATKNENVHSVHILDERASCCYLTVVDYGNFHVLQSKSKKKKNVLKFT